MLGVVVISSHKHFNLKPRVATNLTRDVMSQNELNTNLNFGIQVRGKFYRLIQPIFELLPFLQSPSYLLRPACQGQAEGHTRR